MHDSTFFRRKLARRLRSYAARRRQACADDPRGDDFEIIALFARLACEAERLPQGVIDEVAALRADPGSARRLDDVWDTIPDALGILYVPGSAAELVRSCLARARGTADA